MNQLSKPIVIADLSAAERIIVVEDIWDSIVAEQSALPLTPAQQEELDRRLDNCRQLPEEGDTWEQVKARIQGNQ